MKKESGIVLRRFLQNKSKISILTRKYGKISIMTNLSQREDKLCPGALISFFYYPFLSKLYYVNDIEIVFIPLELRLCDLVFMHHVLEICFYFLPLYYHCPDVFDFFLRLLSFLFLSHRSSNQSSIKKLLIAKLLTLIGFYPKKQIFDRLKMFEEQAVGSVDFFKSLTVKSSKIVHSDSFLQFIMAIDAWIISCLQTHPQSKIFKTIKFLNKI